MSIFRGEGWDGAWEDSRWLMPWVRPHVSKIAVILIFFLSSAAAAVLLPRVVAKIVDDVFVSRTAHFSTWASVLGLLMVVKVTTDLTYKWMVTKVGQTMTRQLRADVFHRLGVFPLGFFSANSSGRLISRCVSDISNLAAFFTPSFFAAIGDMAVILGCLVMLATLSLPHLAVVLALLIPFTVYMLNVAQANMRYSRDIRHIMSRLSGHTADTMNNLGVLHSQPFAEKWIERHARIQSLHAGFTTRAILTWGSFSSLHVLVMGLCYTAIILLGVQRIRLGIMSVGEFIASCTYVMLIFGPFLDIAEKFNTMLTALGSAKRLRSLAPLPTQLAPLTKLDAGLAPRGNIRFEKINFSYRGDSELFRQLELELPEGQVTALVGRTGSGKTTLAQLLLGLYPLQGGRILWGEEDMAHMGRAQHSRWISQVSQDLFLFTETLRENLRLWNEDVSDAMIFDRLERVGLAYKTRALPQGLDTIVKTETLAFSQGERQLLLLCRALLQDPRLLVFDEATANLDQLTEERWLTHVQELFAGRTTLFIAHRLETLRLAHHVVVLSQGKVEKRFSKRPGDPVLESDLTYS